VLITTFYLEMLVIKLETQIATPLLILIVNLVNNVFLDIHYMEIIVINVILRYLIV